MSMTLTENRRVPGPGRFPISRTVVSSRQSTEPNGRNNVSLSTDDEGLAILTTSVVCMVLLAIAPLLLFFVLTFFYPDLFQVSLTPN